MSQPDINGPLPETNENPLVTITVPTLKSLVAKTPFEFHEFERLIGWSFSLGDAPRSKRELAWKILQLSKEQLLTLRELQQRFPKAWVGGIIEGANPPLTEALVKISLTN